jgi:MFS transporter, FSR family, fosmidomycin resistance protein
MALLYHTPRTPRGAHGSRGADGPRHVAPLGPTVTRTSQTPLVGHNTSVITRARGVLATVCGAHFVHDGFSDLLYVLLPVWSQQLGLSFAQTGLLKSVYGTGLAGFQIPAGIWAERAGERRVLAMGTAVTGLAFVVATFTGHYAGLLVCLLVGGLGSAAQHPLSSSLASKAYDGGGRRLALGTYNFSGDLGKMVVPAAAAFAIPWMGWRGAAGVYGIVGVVAAALLLAALARFQAGHPPGPDSAAAARRDGEGSASWGIRDGRGFSALAAVQVIDTSARTAFLTFLPFLLLGKGASVPAVGVALFLLFAGGATGKLACGALAERLGVIRTVVITEAATGLGILCLLGLPLAGSFTVLPVVGMALNGTSSVLYGTVADLVKTERRSRGYALFYTLGLGASAAAPVVYGAMSDAVGVTTTIATVGAAVFLTLPLALALRRPLALAVAQD